MPEGQRIDKWLWHARFAKTRTAAQGLVRSGKIRVNKVRNDSASHVVKVGDVLTMTEPSGIRVVKILATAERRGPAPEARLLYEEEMHLPAARPASPLDGPAGPAKRPHKRDRRLLQRMKRGSEPTR